MSLTGIDVSGFQSLAQLAAVIDRYDWVGVKATEGLHSSNSLHHQQVALARSKGKGVLHYHFFHPGEDARLQWLWFKAFSSWRPGDMLALDVEAADGMSWSAIGAAVAQFLTIGKAASGASIWLYLNQSWRTQLVGTGSARTLTGFPEWIAAYTRNPAVLVSAGPWSTLTAEQWTDNDHGIDGDVFLGDWVAWTKLAVPGVTSSSPLWRWVVAAAVLGSAGAGVAQGTPAVYHPPTPHPVVAHPVVAPAPHPVTPSRPVAPKTGCGCPTTHPAPTGAQAATYVVRGGDTLGSIAARHGTSWQHLAQLNHLSNPNVIHPGQRLTLSGPSTAARATPAAPLQVWVRVASGDTLGGIARRHGTSWQQLAQLNHLRDPSLIYPGQRLRVH